MIILVIQSNKIFQFILLTEFNIQVVTSFHSSSSSSSVISSSSSMSSDSMSSPSYKVKIRLKMT